MTDPKIITLIKKGLAAGFSSQHVKDSLVAKGYNATDVQLALQMVEQEERPQVHRPREREEGTMFMALFVLGLIVFGSLLYFGFKVLDAREVSSEPVMVQATVPPEELDFMMEILASLNANQPVEDALLQSTDAILRTNVSKEDMMAVVRQNNDKLKELTTEQQEDIAKLKYLVGELSGD